MTSTLHIAAAEIEVKRAHELTRAPLPQSTAAVEDLGLGFHLGAALERIAEAGGAGGDSAVRLREAVWLIERHLALLGPGVEAGDHPKPVAAQPVQIVALPSVRRELGLAAARALIFVAAVVLLVLSLTLVSRLG